MSVSSSQHGGLGLISYVETGGAVCFPELHTSCILEGLCSLLNQNIHGPRERIRTFVYILVLKWDCGINVCHGGSIKL